MAKRVVDEEESPSYLDSISDLMSGLLFIFMILLIVFAIRIQDQTRVLNITNEKLKVEKEQALLKTKERLAEVTAERQRWQQIDDQRTHLVDVIATRLRAEVPGLQVQVDRDQVVLGENGIGFDIGNPNPAARYRRAVGQLAAILIDVLACNTNHRIEPFKRGPVGSARDGYCAPGLERWPQCPAGDLPGVVATLLIEGHTDGRPYEGGCLEDNWDLSAARAGAVLRMMRRCEPALDQLLNHDDRAIIAVSGFADSRPLARDDSLADENRRIDLRMLMEPTGEMLAGNPDIATRD